MKVEALRYRGREMYSNPFCTGPLEAPTSLQSEFTLLNKHVALVFAISAEFDSAAQRRIRAP